MLSNGNDNDLYGSYSRRKNESAVVAVSHDNCADETGRNAPACLVGVNALVFLICVLNVESLCETVTEVVRCSCLKCLAVVHESLDSVCGFSSGELVALGLFALYNGHSEGLLAEVCVDIEHTLGLLNCLLSSCVDSVAFLPEELS